MPQAIFKFVCGENTIQLEATTEELAQKEIIMTSLDSIEYIFACEELLQLSAPPVFDDDQENGYNIGPYGDRNVRKLEWVDIGIPYILRI